VASSASVDREIELAIAEANDTGEGVKTRSPS
jgi:hypothetical protein